MSSAVDRMARAQGLSKTSDSRCKPARRHAHALHEYALCLCSIALARSGVRVRCFSNELVADETIASAGSSCSWRAVSGTFLSPAHTPTNEDIANVEKVQVSRAIVFKLSIPLVLCSQSQVRNQVLYTVAGNLACVFLFILFYYNWLLINVRKRSSTGILRCSSLSCPFAQPYIQPIAWALMCSIALFPTKKAIISFLYREGGVRMNEHGEIVEISRSQGLSHAIIQVGWLGVCLRLCMLVLTDDGVLDRRCPSRCLWARWRAPGRKACEWLRLRCWPHAGSLICCVCRRNLLIAAVEAFWKWLFTVGKKKSGSTGVLWRSSRVSQGAGACCLGAAQDSVAAERRLAAGRGWRRPRRNRP